MTRDWIEIDRKHDELKLSMEVDRNDMFGRDKQNRWHHKERMRQHRAKAKKVELKDAQNNNTDLVLEQTATQGKLDVTMDQIETMKVALQQLKQRL